MDGFTCDLSLFDHIPSALYLDISTHNSFICAMLLSVFLLSPAVQTYAWGKLGRSSAVASFSESRDANFKADDATPYAEVSWFTLN